MNWRSFTLSAGRADQALRQVAVGTLTRSMDENSPVQVETPLGEKYDCSSNGMN